MLVNSLAPQVFDGLTIRRRDDTRDRCRPTSLGLHHGSPLVTLGIFWSVARAIDVRSYCRCEYSWKAHPMELCAPAWCSCCNAHRSPPRKSRDQGPCSGGRHPLRRQCSTREIGDRGEDMSSTIGAEETFCVAIQSLADVNGPASYLGWGWLSISVPNLIVILVMILLFVLAIVLPFPKDRQNR